MSKQLYEEAIADLKKVKEIAEDNAKRAVVEAVAPRIRELIEKELLSESDDINDEAHDLESKDLENDKKQILTDEQPEPKDQPPSDHKDEVEEAVLSLTEKEESAEDDTPATDKEEPQNVSGSDGLAEVNQQLLYVEKMTKKLSNVENRMTESSAFNSSVSHLNDMVDAIYGYIQECVEDPNLRLGYGLRLKKCLTKIEKLQEIKMNRDLLNEEDVTLTLTGLPDDVDLEGLGVTLEKGDEGEEESAPEGGEEASEEGGEEASEEGGEELDLDLGGEPENQEESIRLSDNMIVEIDEAMLRKEISRMKMLREESEMHDVQAWGHGPGDVSDEFADEDMGEPLDLDVLESVDDSVVLEVADDADGHAPAGVSMELEDYTVSEAKPSLDTEADEDEDLEEMMSQAHDVSDGQHSASAQPNRQARQVESVRGKMAYELKLQESLRKRASELKKLYEASKSLSSTAKTLLERKEAARETVEIKNAYATVAERYNKSVVRFNKLSQTLSESSVKNSSRSNNVAKPDASAGSDTLRKKLAETNLLNAKLLFTNKLLQTESLTARQKAQIIENLDAAETIREAKLVYESLSKALVKPRKTVTEGRILGSSSQATRPASTQTLNENTEAARWAKLAGIK